MNFTAPFRLLRLPMISLCVLALAGCSLLPAPSSDPTRYYVLNRDMPEVK